MSQAREQFEILQTYFLLGNYNKVFETWSQIHQEDFSQFEGQVHDILTLSFFALEDRKNSDITSEFRANSKLMQRYHQYSQQQQFNLKQSGEARTFSGLNMIEDNDLQVQFIKEFEGTADRNDLLNFIYFIIQLKRQRLDLAEKVQVEFQKKEQDGIFASFALVYLNIHKGKYQDAIYVIDEMKEKYNDTLKLINLKAVALIGLKQYDSANIILQKLYNLFTTKEQYKDLKEMEICLSNLINLQIILGQPFDSYLQALTELNPNSLYIQKLSECERAFDQFVN